MARMAFLFLGCSALGLIAGAPALAQQPTGSSSRADTPSDADAGTIVVTGFRRSEQIAIETKRETFNVVDVVSADDIGRLPDQNTAAALRRIPGVSVQED